MIYSYIEILRYMKPLVKRLSVYRVLETFIGDENSVIQPLFADKNHFSTTIQMIGLIVGAAVAGQLSDSYGRRKVTPFSPINSNQFENLGAPCVNGFHLSPIDDPLLLALYRFLYHFSLFYWDFYWITHDVRLIDSLQNKVLCRVGPIFVLECLPIAHRFWIATGTFSSKSSRPQVYF